MAARFALRVYDWRTLILASVVAILGLLPTAAAASSTISVGLTDSPTRASCGYDHSVYGYDTLANHAVSASCAGASRTNSAGDAADVSGNTILLLCELSAPRGLSTGADEAVFWSGIRGGESTAATWVGKHGGATLETTLPQRGIRLPAWDRNNPAGVAAWRDASAQFAAGARGNVRVLQGDRVRVNSIWAEAEYPALKANPNVTSITAVDPRTGAEVLLWSR